MTAFKIVGKKTENFTPLITRREKIWHKALHLHNIHMMPSPKEDVMGYELGRWCKFHRVNGNHIEECYQLKKEIERLIQEGHLKKYVKGDFSHSKDKYNSQKRDNVGSLISNKAK